MAGKTKIRILEEALKLFSEKGYAGTSIQDIADRIGVTKAALYRHYESKEDLWQSMLNEMEDYYRLHFVGPVASRIPNSLKIFREQTLQQIKFTLQDSKMVQVRKILTVEQFRDKRIADLATKHFLKDLQDRNAVIFADFMERGLLKPSNPDLLALSFISPITLLVHLCDRSPEMSAEILTEITRWIDVFLSQHKCEKE